MSNDYSEFRAYSRAEDFLAGVGIRYEHVVGRPQRLKRIAAQVEARRAELRGEVVVIKGREPLGDAEMAAILAYDKEQKFIRGTIPDADISKIFKTLFTDERRQEEYLKKGAKSVLEMGGEAVTDEAVERGIYGSVAKVPTKEKVEQIRKFTIDDARVLVNEIHSDFIGRVDLTPEQQNQARFFIEQNLFENLYKAPDGFIHVNEAHSFPIMDHSIVGNSGLLNVIMSQRATEVEIDPRNLLMGNKITLALKVALDSGVISKQERNILDPFHRGGRTPEQNDSVIAWYEELNSKLTSKGGWGDQSINSKDRLESVLRKQIPKNLGGDPNDPTESKRPGMTPFGYVDDSEAVRARKAAQADLESLGQGKKSAIEETISRYARDIDEGVFGSLVHVPEVISDPSLKSSVKNANAIAVAEYKEYLSTLPDTMTDAEKGELGEQWLSSYFTGTPSSPAPGVEIMGQSPYVTSVAEQRESIGVDSLSTDTGRTSFLKNKHLNWADLTPEYQRILKDEIAFKSFDEAGKISDARISEYAELSKQQKDREDREDYDLSAAKKDFNNWYWDQNLDYDDLDPDELERWHKKTLRAGGVDGLLRSQQMVLADRPDAEGFVVGPPSPDMVRRALIDNIQAGNADELESDAQAKRDAFNLADANREYRNLTALMELTPEQSEAVRSSFAPQIAKALQLGEFSPAVQNEIASGMKAALDSDREARAQRAINKDFSSFALGIALDQGIIGPNTSEGFINRFRKVTIPRLQNAIFQRGISDSAGMEDLVLGSLKPDEMMMVTRREQLPSDMTGGVGDMGIFATEVEIPVGRPSINLDSVNINEEAYNAYINPVPGTPGSEFSADQRLYFLDLMEEAQGRGQGINALGQIVPFTPGQVAAGQTQDINEVLGSISAQTNATAFPAFPTGEHIPEFGQISATDLRAGMNRTRQARIESETSSDIAGARAELERLQAAGAATDITMPTLGGYDEEGKPTLEGLAVGSTEDRFIRGLMDRSRRDRMRQEEDRAYRREIQRQVPVGAGEFAGAIQQAAGEDVGFQRYLLGQSEAVRRRFEKAGGRTAKAPKDFSEYFVGEELPELSRKYTESPGAIASELGRMETERREVEREEQDVRRRSLRGGRTIMRI